MRLSRILACLAAVGLLSACGSSSSSASSSSTSPAASSSVSGTSTSSPAACQFTSDSVSPDGQVDIQPLGQAAHPITAPATLPCSSYLQVASGTATATYVTSSNHSMCQLGQNPGSSSLAVLWSREPVPADYLFRLAAGQVNCTFYQLRKSVNLCGVGTMSVQGTAAVTAQCYQDPRFMVTVLAGLVGVSDASGFQVLHSAQVLTFDSITNEATVVPLSVSSVDDDMAVFITQARQLRLTPIAQTIAFTSSAPTTANTGDTYQVSAAGGASGNAVALTIDPSSTSVCSISAATANFTSTGVVSSATVTYTAPGTCLIDANQAANALYQAAPQQQQPTQVLSPIS
jgi:hypothetical protein